MGSCERGDEGFGLADAGEARIAVEDASRGGLPSRNWLGHQTHSECCADAADSVESRRAIGAEGFVESFTGDSGGLGDLRHAARGQCPQGPKQEGRRHSLPEFR